MNMIEATYNHADIVGKIHSLAWRQAYEDIFPAEYITADTPENRKKEFLDALQTKECKYYLVYEKDDCVGVVKVVIENKTSEIASIYFLKEFCGKGLGSNSITVIKETYKDYRIILWTLETNTAARKFYERNGFVLTGNTRIISRGADFTQVQYEYKKS